VSKKKKVENLFLLAASGVYARRAMALLFALVALWVWLLACSWGLSSCLTCCLMCQKANCNSLKNKHRNKKEINFLERRMNTEKSK
jgi:hypothetical protein